jgi:CBS domain containing-hemolysin-like protein
MYTLLVILLAAITFVLISVQRTYSHSPIRQLRHLAREGDYIAQMLYRAASYGYSLRIFLWFLIGISASFLLALITTNAPLWFAVAASATILWVGFLWLPAREATRLSVWLALKLAPLFAWALNYLHPIVSRLLSIGRRLHPVYFHTGLYEKEDLRHLIAQQRAQPDNRIEDIELAIMEHALSLSDKRVEEVLTPRRVVRAVSIDESIGPILMSELHDSGLSRFPVYEAKKDNIVGTLYLRDLVNIKQGGLVRSLMRPDVKYIHEDQNLVEALQAIIKTRHHLFIVVNSFEEYVGVLSIEDVLEEILDQPIVDEFDQYEDMRAVASRQARQDHGTHAAKKTVSELAEAIESGD